MCDLHFYLIELSYKGKLKGLLPQYQMLCEAVVIKKNANLKKCQF